MNLNGRRITIFVGIYMFLWIICFLLNMLELFIPGYIFMGIIVVGIPIVLVIIEMKAMYEKSLKILINGFLETFIIVLIGLIIEYLVWGILTQSFTNPDSITILLLKIKLIIYMISLAIIWIVTGILIWIKQKYKSMKQ